ncbi:MAG: sigma-70 family RNA polymerase sigma factor [Desulfobacteraceae bacterium]|jgi:RNA polymerase sigma factor (sigma-70 family)
MIHLEALIKSATTGDDHAFAEIIRRFQDMAFGYAYTLVSDLHLAEDAVQEAFVEAYYNLRTLRDTAAFPGWLKRIVQFRCNRILKRKKLHQVPLDFAAASASKEPNPYEIMERKDIEQKVFNAINGLSQHLREVTTLFFINGYTKNEIADFLEIPENTVKSRLKTSRERLFI